MELAQQDRNDITDLINLHAHLLDSGELDRAGELFTSDVVYDVTDFGSGTVNGRTSDWRVGQRTVTLHRTPLGQSSTNG